MTNSIINNFETMTKFWGHTLESELGVNSSDLGGILLIDAPGQTKQSREKLA